MTDAVVAGVVGSYAYNVTMSLGAGAVITPISIARPAAIRLPYPATVTLMMLVLVLILAMPRGNLTRRDGIILLCGYRASWPWPSWSDPLPVERASKPHWRWRDSNQNTLTWRAEALAWRWSGTTRSPLRRLSNRGRGTVDRTASKRYSGTRENTNVRNVWAQSGHKSGSDHRVRPGQPWYGLAQLR